MDWNSWLMGMTSVAAFGGLINSWHQNRRIKDLEEALGLQGVHTNPESIKHLSEHGSPPGRLPPAEKPSAV